MEPNSGINSIPQSPQTSHRRPAYTFWLNKIVLVLLSSVILGAIFTTAIIMLPYNRVVLLPQIRGSYINITSIHFKDPGYVAVYLQVESGLLFVGRSDFLVPGYYNNVSVFIDPEPIQKDQGGLLVARMFVDNWDKIFDEAQDIIVRDKFGHVYQKKAPFIHPRNLLMEWWKYTLNDPLTVIGDVLIP